jgi:hypothetical protein
LRLLSRLTEASSRAKAYIHISSLLLRHAQSPCSAKSSASPQAYCHDANMKVSKTRIRTHPSERAAVVRIQSPCYRTILQSAGPAVVAGCSDPILSFGQT